MNQSPYFQSTPPYVAYILFVSLFKHAFHMSDKIFLVYPSMKLLLLSRLSSISLFLIKIITITLNYFISHTSLSLPAVVIQQPLFKTSQHSQSYIESQIRSSLLFLYFSTDTPNTLSSLLYSACVLSSKSPSPTNPVKHKYFNSLLIPLHSISL